MAGISKVMHNKYQDSYPMGKKPFFSIIMACCDVEPYIREAMDSVLKQSFGDWECICGIEESKDRTEEILREIAAEDSRVRVFNHPRSGSCSATRNIGIDMAQGEYVIFLDGDDSITDESLARIAEKINIRPGADLYPCAVVACGENFDKKEIRNNFAASSPSEMTGVEALLEINRLCGDYFCPMLQLTVFRRNFLIENDLKCIYGLRRQDSEFTPRALYRAKRVVPLHEPFYLYRLRANSVSSAANVAGYFHKDWAIIIKSLFAFHAQVSRESGFDRRISVCWARHWITLFLYFWFDPQNMNSIPRERRLETLNILFSDGFDNFNLLLKSAGVGKRIAGWWARTFVRCPEMRGLAELFFHCYFRLSGMK